MTISYNSLQKVKIYFWGGLTTILLADLCDTLASGMTLDH